MGTQDLLFQQIKHSLPDHLSFVDEISDLLNISYDSAYRRIRGEKPLPLNELQKLSSHYSISLDALFNLKTNNIVFRNARTGPNDMGIKDWLRVILSDMHKIHEAKEKVIIYSAKDPPLFHYFQIPEIANFKIFFWQKTLLQFTEFEDRQFSLAEYDHETQELGMQSLARYVKIPTIELWNYDTFIIAFSQMEYYWVSGLFEHKEDVFTLCDKFEIWLRHIEKQAELGFKFLYGSQPEGIEENFKLYLNEVVLNDNSIYIKMDDKYASYITDNVLSLLITTNPEFCKKKEKFLLGLCQKSSLISHVNAKERSRFFNRLVHRIDRFRESIK